MIHAYGRPDPPVPRLLEALAARGHAVKPDAAGRPNGPATLVLAAGAELDEMAFGVLLGAWRTAPGARVLVLSAIGAHPDAKEKRLRRLWRIEESARASGVPALTLRLALGFFLWDFIGSALRLPPEWLDLTLTRHLGRPMIGTYDWPGMLLLAIMAVGGLLVAAWGMRRRDVSA